MSAIPDDGVLPTGDLFQAYSVDAYDEELVVGSAMDFSRFSIDLERRTFAIQGRIVYNVGDAPSPTRGKPSQGLQTTTFSNWPGVSCSQIIGHVYHAVKLLSSSKINP